MLYVDIHVWEVIKLGLDSGLDSGIDSMNHYRILLVFAVKSFTVSHLYLYSVKTFSQLSAFVHVCTVIELSQVPYGTDV